MSTQQEQRPAQQEQKPVQQEQRPTQQEQKNHTQPAQTQLTTTQLRALCSKYFPQTNGTGRYIYSVFHTILALVAIYLSFRCNNKFHLPSFIIALCCPYIYIIYILATKGFCTAPSK